MRRFLRGLAKRVVALGVLLLLAVLLVVGGGWAWLNSSGGESFVKQQAVNAINDAIEGSVQFGRLERDGQTVVLTDVKLFTPEGELVATVPRLTVTLDLAALASRRVDIESLVIDDPTVTLVNDARGLNVMRAVAVRNSGGPANTQPGQPLAFSVAAFTINRGAVQYRDAERQVRTTQLGLTGSLSGRTPPLTMKTDATLTGQMVEPLNQALNGSLTMNLEKGEGSLQTALTLGRSAVDVSVDLASNQVTAKTLRLDPEEAVAFVNAWPLKVPLSLTGTLGLTATDAQLTAGHSLAHLQLKKSTTGESQFSVDSDGLDPQELLGASLPSRLSFSLEGTFTGTTVDRLSSHSTLKARWVDERQRELASASAGLKVEHGGYGLEMLTVKTIGASAVANGTLQQNTLAVGADVQLTDAAAIGRALQQYAHVDPGQLSGAGSLHAEVNGPLSDLGVSLRGTLNNLGRDEVKADTVRLALRLPDVRHPMNVDGTVDVQRLRFSGRELQSAHADVVTQGREVSLQLKTAGLGDTSVALKATLDSAMNAALVNSLSLQSTRSTWALTNPTRVVWADHHLAITQAELTSGTQRVVVDLLQGPKQLTGQLAFTDFSLESLPDLVLPASLNARGRLSGTASFNGPWPHTAVQADLRFTHGAVMDVEGIEATLTAAVQNQELTARTEVSSSLATLAARVTLPLQKEADSIDAELAVDRLAVPLLERLLKQHWPVDVSGASAALRLTGARTSPDVQLTVKANAVTTPVKDQSLTVDAVELEMRSQALGPTTLTGHAAILGGLAQFSLAPDVTLRTLLETRGQGLDLKTLATRAHLQLQALQLSSLSSLHLVKHDDFTGQLSATLDGEGTLGQPTLTAQVDVSALGYGSVNAIDAQLVVKASPVDSLASLTASHAGRPLGVAEFRLRNGLQVFEHLDSLGREEFNARATLNEIELREVLPQHAEGTSSPSGRVKAALLIEGTFDHPTIAVDSTIEQLQFSRVPLGRAVLALKTVGTQQTFTARLGNAGRDEFEFKGSTALSLGLADLRQGLKVSATPVQAAFTARNFDIAFLSGFSESVRTVAGTLSGHGAVGGTLGDPSLTGEFALSKGKVSLQGKGEYREIELKAALANDGLTVSQLSCKSGAGQASLTGTVKPTGTGSYRFGFDGAADHFPVVYDDQLMATMSLKDLSLEGLFSDALVDVQRLSLSRVDVELPDVKRKDLQDLERPKDIVVLRGRSKVNSREREAMSQSGAPAKPRTYRAVIDLPRNLWVKSSDLELELGLSDFRVEYQENTQIFGRASVLRGRISVVGRAFDIQPDSQVNFAGAATQPYINVTAIHSNEREKVKVTINVVGRGKDVKLVATSNPSMTETEIYTLLATGRRELRKSASASISPEQALSVIGSLATQQLKSVFANKLPLDVVTFDTGSEDNKSARLEVGKYLTDSVYIGYQWQPFANQQRGENVHAGRVEWQINNHWAAEASAGTAPAGGADFVWSVDY